MPSPSEDPRNVETQAETEVRPGGAVDPSAPTRPEGLEETIKVVPVDLAGPLEGDLKAAFGDRYELGPLLGKGGFGAVFRGFDRRLNRPVAIKATRADRATQADAVAMLDEARRIAQLRHPGIVTIHDVGLVNGRCFLISELLSGPSLALWHRQTAPSPVEIAEVTAMVAEALAHAHSRSLIHRDVKPSNILVIEGRRPVLVDFGLALFDREMSDFRGVISGTLAYMSPEQARGDAHVPDGRTDIYSLGVALYEMICGRPPFRGDENQILQKIAYDPPQPPRQLRPDLPVALEAACLRAMAKDPADRFATGVDFAEALRQAIEARPATASTPSPAPASVLVPSASSREAETSATPPSSSQRSTSRRSGSARRQVTILGATFEPDGDGDLDDVHEAFQAIESACRSIAEAFEGSVLPAAGTAFLACFGYPMAREDSTRRAVRAALAIQAELTTGAAARGWSARVGVHSGVAVVTEAPGQPLSVVGEVVAAVSRLDTTSGGPGVLISDATARLVEGFFESEPAGEARLRPAGPPTPVFRVAGERDARNRIEAADPRRLTPLVGRDREVDLLRERWDLAAEGLGHVMLLVADPGLGKSRLVHVMKEHAAGAVADVIEWACSPYHQNSPFHPLIDAIERTLPPAASAGPDARLDALLRRLVDDGVRDPAAQACVTALLSIPDGGRLPALDLSPERQKERTIEVVLDWLRLRAGRRTVLFVVEDLHWIDPSTEELLRRFVEDGGDEPILALFTYRPEYEPPWRGRGRQTQMALTRLSRRQVTEMVRAHAGPAPVPQAVIDQIVDRTDGVPLFIEEFVKVLADGRAGDPSAGGVLIPATLQDLLIARLDRIESDKDVAQLGAVIGRTFAYDMIRAMSDLDETSLRIELDKLVGADLLFPKGTPPHCTYTFKHALIQDAAYQSLIKRRRQEFHRTIAERLEAAFPEVAATQPEVLARHFTEAGLTARGIDYWHRAGLRARERSAHPEAIRHLVGGLELVAAEPPSPARDASELGFRVPLCGSYLAVRGYASPQVEEQILRARALCEALGPDSPLFPVMMITWALRLIQGRNALARTLSDELLALAEARDDDSLRAEARWSGSCTALWAGRFRDALDHGERGLERYQIEPAIAISRLTQQNSGPLITAYTGLALWALGWPDQARRRMDEAVALAERLRHPYSLAVTLWKPGFMCQLAGDADGTMHWAERVLAVSQEQSFEFWITLGISLKGAALSLAGRHGEAVPLLTEAIRRMEATGCEMVHQNVLGCLAEALWRTGRRDEARAALDRAFALTERDDERYVHAELLRRKGVFLAEETPDDPGPAVACFEAALAIAGAQEARFFELRAALALARVAPTDAARARVRDLASRFTEGFDAPDLVAAAAFLKETP